MFCSEIEDNDFTQYINRDMQTQIIGAMAFRPISLTWML